MSATALATIQHRIGGTETPGSSTRTAPVFDPATGAQQAEVVLADPADVDAAVRAARGLRDAGATCQSPAARA